MPHCMALGMRYRGRPKRLRYKLDFFSKIKVKKDHRGLCPKVAILTSTDLK